MSAPVPAKSTLLGLGYLASVLQQRGHEVRIKDFSLDKKLEFDFRMFMPDVIGISIMFSEYKSDAFEVITTIKHYFPHIQIIAGGAHVSTFPEECVEYADTVVVGEGEEVIDEIIKDRRRGIIRAERIRDLDNLLMPAWDLMKEDMDEINRLSAKSPFLMRRPLAHIITSRGCPNNCAFCAVKVSWGRQWIARSAKNVVDEIEYLYKQGFREIHFNDDNCSISRERMYQICDLIRIRGIKIKIACPTGIHIMTLDKPLLKLMKRAGFYRLCFGIETGNEEMQKRIHKNINLDKAREVIKDANNLGFWTSATFIFGFPEETEAQRQDTIDFAKTSGIDFPIYYNLQIQAGTELWNLTHSIKTS
jgi:radical SAM superfamily enzyme YgiQ (UPF0313 family)